MYVFEVETIFGNCKVSLDAKDWNDFAPVVLSGDNDSLKAIHNTFGVSYDAVGNLLSLDQAAPVDISIALRAAKNFPSGVVSFVLAEGKEGLLESPPDGAIF